MLRTRFDLLVSLVSSCVDGSDTDDDDDDDDTEAVS